MPFVSPAFKIRCPYCREVFHPSDMKIISSANARTILYDPDKRSGLGNFASRFWTRELTGEKYTLARARRQCPSCGEMLPEREIDETFNIAIVGDTFSGKTHYIAVLIDQLRRGLLTQAGTSSSRLVSLSEETDKEYREKYFIPILRDKNVAPATLRGKFSPDGRPQSSKPLVFQMTLSDNQTGLTKGINLLFYDISGEDIADSTMIVQFGEHILRANAIIYLADPIAMERVRKRLPKYLRPDPTFVSSRSAHEVLVNIMYRYEQYQRIRPGEQIDVPTAIMITKSDLLKYTMPVSRQSNYLIFQNRVYDGKAHPQEFVRIHREVESCLQYFNELALLKACSRFTTVNFFAVSAMGGPPDSNGAYIDIQPLRCLDPFVWILWKLGCIEVAQP